MHYLPKILKSEGELRSKEIFLNTFLIALFFSFLLYSTLLAYWQIHNFSDWVGLSSMILPNNYLPKLQVLFKFLYFFSLALTFKINNSNRKWQGRYYIRISDGTGRWNWFFATRNQCEKLIEHKTCILPLNLFGVLKLS